MTANTHSKQHKVRGYRAIAQFSGLGGPFMTGTRVAEFVRMRQKAYRLARLNALTEALTWSEFPAATAAQIRLAVAQAHGFRRATVVPLC
jgi:hypothetical protein